MKVKLSVYKDDQVCSEIDLGQQTHANAQGPSEFFIGRSHDCHVFLDHPQVSRIHAIVSKKGDSWYITKSTSYSPLIINGIPYENKELSSGDIISITPFIIHISISKESQSHIPSSVSESGPIEASNNSANEFNEKSDDDQILEPSNQITVQETQKDELGAVDSFGDNEKIQSENENDGSENKSDNDHNDGDDNDQWKGDSGDNLNSGNFGGDGGSQDLVPTENSQEQQGGGEGFGGDFQNDSGESSQGEGGSESEGDAGDHTRAMTSFAQYSLKIFGEFAPYDEYVIQSDEVLIGRNKEKCQIFLNDPEVSGGHAVIKKSRFFMTLQDLESSNGTILNGSRINQAELANNDEFVIGSTTFTVIVKSDLLQVENNRLMPVEENQEVVVEEVVEEESDLMSEGDFNSGDLGQNLGKAGGQGGLKDFNKKRAIIYGLALIAVGALFLPNEEEKKDGKDGASKESKEGKEKTGDKDSKDQGADAGGGTEKEKVVKKKKRLSPEEKQYLESAYQLAKKYFDEGMYKEAEFELNKIFEISEDGYKNALQIKSLITEGYKQIQAVKDKEEKEKLEKVRKEKIDTLVGKAKDAVKEKKVELAEKLFSNILELDPEQSDVSLMRMEIDAWKKEQERVELEKVQKKAERDRKVNALSPGKEFYLKKKWFNAINKLEEFLRIKDMDEDLTKDATHMLEESKKNLNKSISPLLGKARSLKEGQDLKGAYDNYMNVLKIDPTNVESLNEMSNIRDVLDLRLRKIYREALIAEELSLFTDAKEKLQEVQQIAPTDNEYYKKATEKLREYIE